MNEDQSDVESRLQEALEAAPLLIEWIKDPGAQNRARNLAPQKPRTSP